MPTVPTYGGQQVDPRPLPGAELSYHTRTSPDAYGAPIAAGVGAGASAAAAISNQVRDQQDEVAVMDAENQAQQRKVDLLTNPDTGALNKRGKDALGVVDPTMQAYQQSVGEIGQGLANDRQRRLFTARANAHGTELFATLQSHVAGQAKQLDDETTNTSVQLNRDQAIASATDPQAVQLGVDRQVAALKDYARRNGLPPEWVDLKTSEAASATHSGAIENLLANDQDQAASERYEAVKDQLTGPDRTKLASALDIASTRGGAQRVVDGLMLEKGDDGKGLTLEQGMTRIADEAGDNPKLREAAEQRWVHMKTLAQEAHEQDQKTTMQDLYNQARDPANVDGFSALDPVKLASLDPQRQEALRAWARKPDDRPTDLGRWNAVDSMLSSAAGGDATAREALHHLDLMLDLPHLSNEDFKALKARQDAILTGKPSKDEAAVYSRREVADQSLRGIGIDPNTKDPAQAQRVAMFQREVNRAVLAQEQTTGKPVTSDDVQKITDQMVVQHVTAAHSFWWDTKARAFELPGADKIAYSPAQVPASDRQAIVDSFQRRKQRAPTEQEVLSAYNAGLGLPPEGSPAANGTHATKASPTDGAAQYAPGGFIPSPDDVARAVDGG